MNSFPLRLRDGDVSSMEDLNTLAAAGYSGADGYTGSVSIQTGN